MNSESRPLLGDSDASEAPTFLSSFKVTATSSYVNLFLIFVPIAIVFSALHASDTVVFTLNFLAIIPLAKLLGFGKVNYMVIIST
jgi:Ca2+:H+ antiporter